MCESCKDDHSHGHNIYKEALEKIRDNEGHVCKDYEVCQHTSCRSAYTSWAIADEALKAEMNGKEKSQLVAWWLAIAIFVVLTIFTSFTALEVKDMKKDIANINELMK